MECNRDEAKRAKEIAESKLSAKDIMGAHKFALKAQSLYPGLDGISQLLAILDVYVAAENKINGQLDFYGILGVSPSADDDTVKKHYRKLALSLHPDKNKSIGAEGAFQYVSQAWNLLSDKDKRSAYDHKRIARVIKHKFQTQNGGSRAPPAPRQNGFYNFTKSTATQTKVTPTRTTATTPTKVSITKTKDTTNSPKDNINATTKTVPASVSSSSNKQTVAKTFWTVCKRCKLQYEFMRVYLNQNLLCPTCYGPFLATESPPPNTGSGVLGASKNVSNPGTCDQHTSSQWGPFSKTTSPAAVARAANMVRQTYERVKRDREEAQAAIKREEALRKKMAKKAAMSSKHLNTKQDVDANKGTDPVGSSGQVEIKKDVSNNGIKNQLIKKATMEIKKKLHEWSSATVKDSIVGGVSNAENGDMREKGKSVASVNEPHVTDVPDPDFHDFGNDISEKCFEEGQVWAAYDDHDGMPRSYAIIRRVITLDPFQMKVCWLNLKSSKPALEAFGEFEAGNHDILTVPNFFSHKASFTKVASGNICVFPRKGDVCALHRNDLVKCKYEIVEVDEYNEETGITVTPLIKVAGFKTVFHRHLDPKETRVVPVNDIFRLSHKIPSYLLTGQEAPSAPKGCRELDPAALPPEFLQVTEIVDEAGKTREADSMDVEECSKY